MSRTKLRDRVLPDYTKGEEIFNMVSHIVGGAFGIIVLVLCSAVSIKNRNWWGLGSGIFYALNMIFLYTMSSVYHGLTPGTGKKVLQILDHCTIYALIIGTYAPILCSWLRVKNFTLFIIVICLLVAATAVGVTFTAIDFTKYRVLSYASYFVIGWMALLGLYSLYKFYDIKFILWLVFGGVAYTSGMIFFGLGAKNHRYCHSVFHLFILAGSVLQFIGIFKYCFLG